MRQLLYALNIGTLSTWLGVVSVGVLGGWVKTTLPPAEKDLVKAEASRLDPVIEMGEEDATEDSAADLEKSQSQADAQAPDSPVIVPATIPEMPDISDQKPLPEVPQLPDPVIEEKNDFAVKKISAEPKIKVTPKPAPAPKPKPIVKAPPVTEVAKKAQPAVNPRPNSVPPKPATGSTSGNAGSGSTSTPGAKFRLFGGSGNGNSPKVSDKKGNGLTQNERISQGKIFSPSYPSEAKSKNQTGTVTVSFTVDRNGKVISAVASKPSPWPLLNEEAVKTVRRWKFPPGDGIMQISRPITFKLK